MLIRPTQTGDRDAVWAILEPVIRAGETYPLPRDMSRDDALAYWLAPAHRTFIAEEDGRAVGIYYLRPNNAGGGGHVANCGYMTAPHARGRGVARAMGEHSLDQARTAGFAAMQFNFVIATNAPSIRLWTGLGFTTLCRLPGVFRHPGEGYVDALVMFKAL